jgi:hypothetical protein
MRLNKLHDLDWKQYDDLVFSSISYEYYPKEDLDLHPGKSIETFLELKEEGIVYVPISKNASQSITNSFNFSPVKTTIQPNCPFYIDIPEKYRNEYKFFIITRDPKERWVSGINEFLNIYDHEGIDFDGDKKGSRNKFLKELKNNKFIFDGHTAPQVSTVRFCFKYDLDIKFFKLDENLNEKISDFLKRNVTIIHDNPTAKYGFKLKNYNFCHDILTKYCMKNEKFLKLYEMDFYLYDHSL